MYPDSVDKTLPDPARDLPDDLYISYNYKMTLNNFQVTDETLRHLADNCPNIQILVNQYFVISSERIKSIFSFFYFKTLSRCEQITDEGVRYICSSTSAQENLHILELDNCPTITDISIDHLLSCQNLKRLDIFDCQQITKNAVKKIQV